MGSRLCGQLGAVVCGLHCGNPSLSWLRIGADVRVYKDTGFISMAHGSKSRGMEVKNTANTAKVSNAFISVGNCTATISKRVFKPESQQQTTAGDELSVSCFAPGYRPHSPCDSDTAARPGVATSLVKVLFSIGSQTH
jgi:hypothetical protein